MDIETKTLELPRYAKTALNKAFKQAPVEKSIDGYSWFMLHDQQTTEYLIRTLGLSTGGMPIYNLNNAYKVWFDWSFEGWIVSA